MDSRMATYNTERRLSDQTFKKWVFTLKKKSPQNHSNNLCKHPLYFTLCKKKILPLEKKKRKKNRVNTYRQKHINWKKNIHRKKNQDLKY